MANNKPTPKKFDAPNSFKLIPTDAQTTPLSGDGGDPPPGCPMPPPGCVFIGQVQIGDKVFCQYQCEGYIDFKRC